LILWFNSAQLCSSCQYEVKNACVNRMWQLSSSHNRYPWKQPNSFTSRKTEKSRIMKMNLSRWQYNGKKEKWKLPIHIDLSAMISVNYYRTLWKVRPCIPNLNSNVRVGIRVRTSFLRFPNFNFNVIFL